MATRLSTCKGCNKQITKDEKHTYSGKTYCVDCYDVLNAENQQRLLLLKTICEYYNLEVPTGIIMKQIKDYKEDFKYTYAGMTYTLYYIKTMESKPFGDAKFGIAFIKYYYEKAKAHFEQQQKISESVNIVNHQETKVNIVTINLNKVYSKPNSFLHNLNDLIGENT